MLLWIFFLFLTSSPLCKTGHLYPYLLSGSSQIPVELPCSGPQSLGRDARSLVNHLAVYDDKTRLVSVTSLTPFTSNAVLADKHPPIRFEPVTLCLKIKQAEKEGSKKNPRVGKTYITFWG